jgi:hypothetical protein
MGKRKIVTDGDGIRWTMLEGYPGYLVSDSGFIWSIAKGPLNLVKGRPNTKGYLQVVLYKRVGIGTEKHQRYVHRLVAENFIGPSPGENYQVNHMDKDRANNKVTNLEWLLDIENYKHRDGLPYKRANDCT